MVLRIRAFRELDLAEHHRAGLFQPPHDGGVFAGAPVLQHHRAAGRGQALGGQQILERNRRPMQDAERRTRGALRIQRLGLRQGAFAEHGDVGAELAVVLRYAFQHGLRDATRREFAALGAANDFGEREGVDVHGGVWLTCRGSTPQ